MIHMTIFVYNDVKPEFMEELTTTWFKGSPECHAVDRDDVITKIRCDADYDEDLDVIETMAWKYQKLHIDRKGA